MLMMNARGEKPGRGFCREGVAQRSRPKANFQESSSTIHPVSRLDDLVEPEIRPFDFGSLALGGAATAGRENTR